MEKPTFSPTTSDLIGEIQRLQAARQSHVDALRTIDEVLAGVAKMLAAAGGEVLARTSMEVTPISQLAGASSNPLLTADFPVGTVGITRRRYHRLPQTGEDFVLSFVREHGAPTTLQINMAWKAQGRRGAANNVIGRLLKQGLLEREPLGERRGSRYKLSSTLAEGPGAN